MTRTRNDKTAAHVTLKTTNRVARRLSPDATVQGAIDGAHPGLLTALGVPAYTTDAEGNLTSYNDAAVDFWGYRPDLREARWCGSWRLFDPDGNPMRHEDCPMAVALKEQRAVRGVEAIAERPDGTRVPFMPYPMPLRDEVGKLVGAVNVLVDISDRKAAQAALADKEEQLRRVKDHARMRHVRWSE